MLGWRKNGILCQHANEWKMSVCLVIMFWAGRHGPECACHQKQTNIFARSAVIFRAGNTNSRRSPCFAAFHSNPVTRAASSWFGGLVISLSLCGRRWKTCTKVCAGKERYSNLPDDINEAVGNQIYGVVDSNSDADLYHKVLSFISVNGVGESWEIRQSANPTGGCLLVELDKMSVLSPTPCSSLHDTMQPEVRLHIFPPVMELTAQPGLGWHRSDWNGQKIRSLHFEQGQRKVAIFIEGGWTPPVKRHLFA
eukprot:s2434_g5.t1